MDKYSLYMKKKNEVIVIVCLYVDVVIFTRVNPKMFNEFETTFSVWWHSTRKKSISLREDIQYE